MKYISFIFLLSAFINLQVNGQDYKQLEAVSKQDSENKHAAIIYGNFIQRLGISSNGFSQDIRILNVETKEIISFRVKPTFKSTRENTFCFYLKPGTYKILNYLWTQSKWYGGKMHEESIYKGVEPTKVAAQVKEGKILQYDLEQYSFVIADNSVYYLGTWHFDKELVSFTNGKKELDEIVQTEYPNINWKQAKVEIPN